jgi:hypothetical protein
MPARPRQPPGPTPPSRQRGYRVRVVLDQLNKEPHQIRHPVPILLPET